MMPDREKVISTLEEIKKQTAEIGLDSAVIAHEFIDKIIALLKEQEPPSKEDLTAHYGKMYKCRKCGLEWYQQTQKYCQECGTAVKLE